MKLYLDTSKSPLACLTVSDVNQTLKPMQTIFFGDILPFELVLHDGAGGQPSWINDAQIKVGFGDLKGQNPFFEQVCVKVGDSFTASLDFTLTDFDQATQGIEKVGIVFEVQASFTNGTTETICQQRLDLNNQILNQQTVSLTAPAQPLSVLVDLVPQPRQPASVSVDIAPLPPRDVLAVALIDTLPEQPSLVVALTRPAAPSSVTGGLVPYPPSSVVAISNPLAPSSVTALTKPLAPSSVTGGRFPNQPFNVYIEPEEPDPTILWHPFCNTQADLIFWADARAEELMTSDENANIEFVQSKQFGAGYNLTQTDPNKRFSYDSFDDAFLSESGESLELDDEITPSADLKQDTTSEVVVGSRVIFLLDNTSFPVDSYGTVTGTGTMTSPYTGNESSYYLIQSDDTGGTGTFFTDYSLQARGTRWELVTAKAMQYYIVAEGQGDLLTGGTPNQTQEWASFEIAQGSNGQSFAQANANLLNGAETKYLVDSNLQGWSPQGRQLINLEINLGQNSGILRINGEEKSNFTLQEIDAINYTFPTVNTTFQAPFTKIKIISSWHPHLTTGNLYDLKQMQVTNGVLSNFKLGDTTAGDQWVGLGGGRGVDWQVVTTEKPAFIFDKIGGGWDGKIHEVILFEGGNVPAVEGYLAHKWQIQDKLPSNHTYKTTEPKSCLHNDPCHSDFCFQMENDSGQMVAITLHLNNTRNVYTQLGWFTVGEYSASGGAIVSGGLYFQEDTGAKVSTVVTVQLGLKTKRFLFIYHENKCPTVISVQPYTNDEIDEIAQEHGESVANVLTRHEQERLDLFRLYGLLCDKANNSSLWFCEDPYANQPAHTTPALCL